VRKPKKRILLVKIDAIGDYVLFRNFIEELASDRNYEGYAIDLVAGKLCEEIAIHYDGMWIRQFYFVNQNDLLFEPTSMWKLAWKLFNNKYEKVLYPTYSRTLLGDGIVGVSAAKERIGFETDHELLLEKYKKKTDAFYSKKLALPDFIRFEFNRSKFFFSTLLQRDLNFDGPHLPVSHERKNSIILFVGAGYFKRNWQIDNFRELISLMINHTEYDITLAGSKADSSLGNYLEESFNTPRLKNTIGRTTLLEVIQLIAESKLVCILGGGHFDRFAPYPPGFNFAPVCVFEPLPCFKCNWNCIHPTEEQEAFPCISGVSVDSVWRVVQNLLTINASEDKL
jgi:ADP-heptose:LPS heptosyltransferase